MVPYNKEKMVVKNSSPFQLRKRDCDDCDDEGLKKDFDDGCLRGARILSEIIPIAAGVYSTTYFVIIPHRGVLKKEKKLIQLEKSDRGEKRQRMEDDSGLDSDDHKHHAPIHRSATPPSMEPRPVIEDSQQAGEQGAMHGQMQGEEPSDQKPPYTYTDLITLALKEKIALTVSGIYQWITERYPYFKAEDDRWKNSVRHNLSMNPHFRKGIKSKNGAGHNWVLADEYQDALKCQFAPVKIISTEDEADAAVRSILSTPPGGLSSLPGRLDTPHSGLSKPSCVEDVKEGGAKVPRPSLPDPALQKSAEDILAGVKRQAKVEVQYLVQDKQNTDSWRPADGPPCKKPLLVLDDHHISSIPLHTGLDLTSTPLHLTSPSQLITSSPLHPSQLLTHHSIIPPSHHVQHSMVLTTATHPSHQVTSAPFCPIEQIPELDVPVYSYQYTDYANIDYNDVDGLEKALGIDFQGVVQRELLAK